MEKVLRLCCFSYLYGITGQGQMQYVCGRMSRVAQKRNPGRGSQRLHCALGGTRILLAAAPTAPPCFCRWQRSSLLHRGFFPRRTIRRVLRVALAAFSAAPWQGFEKAERCPSLASLFPPQAAVGSAAVRIHPCIPFFKADKTETPIPIGYRSSWWSEAT